MSKKNFNSGLNSLLGGNSVSHDGKQLGQLAENFTPAGKKEIASSVKVGLKSGETRATLILNEEFILKLKAISYWDRLPLKIVVNNALESFIANYEESCGKIKAIPK